MIGDKPPVEKKPRITRASIAALLCFATACACGVIAMRLGLLDRMTSQASVTEAMGQSARTQTKIEIRAWHTVVELEKPIAQFETVFWDAADTDTLRAWLKDSNELADASVLEIGTGTGLISLVCAGLGAKRVVATDANQIAVQNAQYNASEHGLEKSIEVRFAKRENSLMPGPFSPIGNDERFDLILSNPPWEDSPVTSDASMAYYDPGFRMLDAFLTESSKYLKPDGVLLLSYGAKNAIARIREDAPQSGWDVSILDQRDLDSLPEVFLPAMLIKLQQK